MAGAAAALARRLHDEGRIDGVLAAGGSGNTAIATAAMQALPVGVPKLMVSTMAAGDTRDYVGGVDVTLMAAVTDVAGVNSISARILANAAAAMAGMVSAPPVEVRGRPPAHRRDDVRRHHPVRDPRARGARGAAATRCSSSTRRAPAARRWRRSSRAASSPACWTRRRRSCATTSSAACSPPAPTGSRPRAAPGSRRSSRWARSTWSTSARATRCRPSSRTATSTSTTRRSRSCARRPRRTRSSAGGSRASSRRRPARSRCSCRSRASR